jgi:hypothetical protein
MSRNGLAVVPVMRRAKKPKFPRSFGTLSPAEQMVLAFENDADAEHARLSLIEVGFGAEGVTRYTGDEVLAEFRASEEQILNPLQLGDEISRVEQYLELANQGAGFLVVVVPDDTATRVAVDISKPLGLKFGEKYTRVTLEELA